MELGNSNSKQLLEVLKGAGLYEDGMDVEEMRQVAEAMQASATTYEVEYETPELERAIMESELDFASQSENTLLSSTMIAPFSTASAIDAAAGSFIAAQQLLDCESPVSEPVEIVVHALVHRPMDWSPTAPERRSARKRNAIEGTNSMNDSGGCHSKRSHRILRSSARVEGEPRSPNADATPISLAEDSGVSWEEIGSISSINESSNIPSIGEVPSRLLISTSSAAVSDFSRSDHDGSEEAVEQEENSQDSASHSEHL